MGKYRSEQGQVLILIVLSIVGLMGFAALAVDISNVFATRRHAQDAVDAAALAAASAASHGQNYSTAAMALAKYNGFDMDTDPHANSDKETDVQVFNPPVSGPYATVSNKTEYFQVIIRTKVRKIFSQFVFGDDEVVTVEAVTHSVPTTSSSSGQALFATGYDTCPGIVFNGNMTTYVKGGNIFSNAKDSGSCTSGKSTGTSGSVTVVGGDVEMVGSWTSNTGFSVSPSPVKTGVARATPLEIPAPSCANLPTRYDNTEPLLPGYYPNGIRFTGGDHTMAAGFYCIGGEFTVNGGTLTGPCTGSAVCTAGGNGVGIYMTSTAGAVNLGGNGAIQLYAGSKIVDGLGNSTMNGMLIYMDKANQNIISMAGGAGTFYHGTIYAIGPSSQTSQEKCNITGSSSGTTLRSNIICYSINISGSSSLTIDYRPEENFQLPPTLDVIQ